MPQPCLAVWLEELRGGGRVVLGFEPREAGGRPMGVSSSGLAVVVVVDVVFAGGGREVGVGGGV